MRATIFRSDGNHERTFSCVVQQHLIAAGASSVSALSCSAEPLQGRLVSPGGGMQRRAFFGVLGGAAMVWLGLARAQTLAGVGKRPVIGIPAIDASERQRGCASQSLYRT